MWFLYGTIYGPKIYGLYGFNIWFICFVIWSKYMVQYMVFHIWLYASIYGFVYMVMWFYIWFHIWFSGHGYMVPYMVWYMVSYMVWYMVCQMTPLSPEQCGHCERPVTQYTAVWSKDPCWATPPVCRSPETPYFEAEPSARTFQWKQVEHSCAMGLLWNPN